MGQTLSSPATEKKSEDGGNHKYAYAVAEMQGWRITMEDAHAVDLNLDGEEDKSNTFFAVYDGHGGGTVAKYAGENLHKRLTADEAYNAKLYPEALKNAFLGTDADMRANPSFQRDPSGCTAVAALVTNDGRIFVANAGDSRSVISVKGEVKPLSFDHKPQNDSERSRIVAAGGYVEFGRVNGNLALARALGDFDYKKSTTLPAEHQIITSNPEVTEHNITDEDEFLVIACDGIWDCLTSQQVVDVIRLLISQGKKLKEVGEIICDHCLAPDTNSGAGIGCDNMTILVVALLNGRTEEEWYQWVTDRTKRKYGFNTPEELPQLYSVSRLMSFRARRQAEEERERLRKDRELIDGRQAGPSNEVGAFGGYAKVLGSTGGLSFHPGSGLLSVSNPLMFDSDDSDDDFDDEDDIPPKGGISSEAFHKFSQSDIAKTLQRQLDQLRGFGDQGDGDGDLQMGEIADEDTPPSPKKQLHALQGETPPPPKPLVNGNSKHIEQLHRDPEGDAPSDAVLAEGLADSSESPFKV